METRILIAQRNDIDEIIDQKKEEKNVINKQLEKG